MSNNISEILIAAEEERVIAKLASLAQEPTELYEIVDRIAQLAKKNKYDEIALVSNYDIFKLFFCINNDLMAILQADYTQYFESPISYDELYAAIEESEAQINSWTFDMSYEHIRKINSARNVSDLINACQSLGLAPTIVNYDISQPFVAMSNLLFYKKQIAEIKASNKSPSVKRSEMKKLYGNFLRETVNVLETRLKETRRFYRERKANCEAKIECLKELEEKADSGELENLDLMEQDWHLLFGPKVLTPLYELLIENQRKRHQRVLATNREVKTELNKTPFIKYLYEQHINPNTVPIEVLEKANAIPFEILEERINFFQKLSITLQELLTLHIDYLFNIEQSTLTKFNFYIDKGIIKKDTLKKDLSILNKIHIIDTNYSILKPIIDITSPYYKDTILILSTSEIKKRLSILSQYNLSINNYMFLLSNFDYINVYDLMIENKIPIYLLIAICKTSNPLLTIKKIMISIELDLPYENNGRLSKEIRNDNAFMCSNETIDEYIENCVPEYMIGDIKSGVIGDVLNHPLVQQLDTNYRRGDIYLFGTTRISRPKVLSKLQTLLSKKIDISKYLLFCILSNSILSERNIAEIKKCTGRTIK